jgi:hypothetical protein
VQNLFENTVHQSPGEGAQSGSERPTAAVSLVIEQNKQRYGERKSHQHDGAIETDDPRPNFGVCPLRSIFLLRHLGRGFLSCGNSDRKSKKSCTIASIAPMLPRTRIPMEARSGQSLATNTAPAITMTMHDVKTTPSIFKRAFISNRLGFFFLPFAPFLQHRIEKR